MYIYVKVSDPLNLESQAAMSCHVGAGNPGPLEELPVLLTAEPSLQPRVHFLKLCLHYILPVCACYNVLLA